MDKLENSILPYLIGKKINELVQKELSEFLTDFTQEDGYLWWRVRGENTGMWLRVGDIYDNGKTLISFWAGFYNCRQYAPYRYAQRGDRKDWLIGEHACETFDWNLLRKGEHISSKSIKNLVDEIVEFYKEPVGKTGKTIDEIIEECNPVIEK